MTAPRSRVVAAFGAIYLIWGSTYLFMRFAVETLPPLAITGIRFFAAGGLLFLLSLLRRQHEPERVPWRGHALVGTLLALGNASVTFGVQRVPSGVASLLVAMTPALMVLLEWRGDKRRAPGLGVTAGLVLGLAGMVVLIGAGMFGGVPVDTLGAGVVLAGTVAWSSGSIYSRSLSRWRSGLKTSGVQMMCGGLVVALIAVAAGELRAGDLRDVSTSSLLSLLYLVLFGSVVGYSAYMYLLGVTSAARVSTYAFVNPVVAVLLGALFAGEDLSLRVAAAGALIVSAVAMITFFGGETTRFQPKQSTPVREAP